jgi:mannose-1-phosphate guanylyltransferase
MKIRPIILCGGAGTRLWPDQKKNLPKQFVDFGGWTLIQKTLERIKTPIFDFPVISTNLKYLKKIRYFLKKNKINKYKIVLEPKKKNTAPAVLSSALIKDIPLNQPLVYFVADNLIEKPQALNRSIVKNKANLNNQNIFIFGFKPKNPTSEYGYFLTKKIKKNINKVTKFIEKPNINKAKQIIKKNGYWNAGMFYLRKDSIINNFKKYQPNIYRNCNKAVTKAKYKSNVYYLN